MLPIGDDNSELSRFPGVTYALLALNVLAFVYELTLGPELNGFIRNWGTVPAVIADGSSYESLFTSMFLHGGWGHLIGNMLFLKIFGDNVEDRLGHIRFLLLYLLTGLAASGAHIALNLDSSVPSVGASGAISGILGAYIVMFPKNRVMVWMFFTVFAVPAWAMIGFWAAEQFASTLGTVVRTEQTTGGIAYAAHAGGFVAGIIGALILRGFGDSGRGESAFGERRYYR